MAPLEQSSEPLPALEAAAPMELAVQGEFVEWLAASGATVAVSTYNSGKLAIFSAPEGQLAATYWKFVRPMGLAAGDGMLALATRNNVWELRGRGVPDVAAVHSTGRLDAHDVAYDRRGLLFAATRFNCVARPSDRVQFRRHWQPPFITEIKSGDRCHLNGVGVKNGRLAMATAFCEGNALAAWRGDARHRSGLLIDARANRIVASNLCMPHSPRWHDGRWWLCNSGEGTLAVLDPARGACEALAALPGFTRGLAFGAGRALVGLSRVRKRHLLDAPPVRQRFPRLRAGVSLVDLATGAETGSLEFVRGGREVYDVAFLQTPSADAAI